MDLINVPRDHRDCAAVVNTHALKLSNIEHATATSREERATAAGR